MCVFMICIDPCAWQIGYKLGNILPGKWNTLDCRSTLGGVLNSHGQCDILFVGVRTSVIVCVCLSGVIVIYRWYLVLYGNILAPQYVRLLDTLVMSEGKGWVCPLGSQESPAKPMVTPFTALSVSLKMKISAGEIFDRSSFLQVWIWIMFFFKSIKATTTKTSKQTKETLPKSPKIT